MLLKTGFFLNGRFCDAQAEDSLTVFTPAGLASRADSRGYRSCPLRPLCFPPPSPKSALEKNVGGHRAKKCGNLTGPPRRDPKHRLLGPSWSALGPVLGPSWAPLGALLGNLGAILRPRKPIGSETARMQKTLVVIWFLKDFALLEASLESHLASWSRLGAVLGPLGASWEPS